MRSLRTALLAMVLLAMTSVAAAAQRTDTTFAVQRGGRLQLDLFHGSVTVRTWDRDAMRVVATHARGGQLRVRQRSGAVSLEVDGPGVRMGPGQNVRYEIVVPRNFGVHVEGMNTDVTIEGVQGGIDIENVEGAVRVTGVTGNVRVTSVSGAVTLSDVRGDVAVETVNQSLRLTGVRGRIEVETVNGGIHMDRIESRAVSASTVNGAVEYRGTVSDGGRYELSTHNGRITMAVPENANATLEIATRVGQVQSDFPVRIGSMSRGSVTVTLGSGSARVELESFNGAVRLVRP